MVRTLEIRRGNLFNHNDAFDSDIICVQVCLRKKQEGQLINLMQKTKIGTKFYSYQNLKKNNRVIQKLH